MSNPKNVFTTIFVLFALISCNGRVKTESSETKEEWDKSNRPSLMGALTLSYDQLVLTSSQRGSLNFKPWKSGYWPYSQKNIANRYLSESEFFSASDQIANASLNPGEPLLSPAEKYDLLANSGFELTQESWKRYNDLLAKYGSDYRLWDWMGICAGWAPASISEPEPRRHVLASTDDGQEILFFSGDIRALLSKAYDVNATEKGYVTVGLRCNEAGYTIPRDERGRIVDGQLTASQKNFTMLSDYSDANGAIEVIINDSDTEPFWLVADTPFRRIAGPKDMWRYRSRSEIANDISAGSIGKNAIFQEKQAVIFYKGCRDINPASLHMSLVTNISESAPVQRGFILEISQAQEVWNHPVWGYTSKIAHPKALSEMGREDRMFRAPGATHTVDVETKLIYGTGASPAMEYREAYRGPINWHNFAVNAGRYEFLVLNYTLELDDSGLVIGGEWDKSMDRRKMVPDFYWMVLGKLTDNGKNGDPSVVKYSVLQKLNACSQRATDTSRDVWISGELKPVPVVTCRL